MIKKLIAHIKFKLTLRKVMRTADKIIVSACKSKENCDKLLTEFKKTDNQFLQHLIPSIEDIKWMHTVTAERKAANQTIMEYAIALRKNCKAPQAGEPSKI